MPTKENMVGDNLFESCDFLYGLEDIFQAISEGVETDFELANLAVEDQSFKLTVSRFESVHEPAENMLLLSLEDNQRFRKSAQATMQAKNEVSLANRILDKAKDESERSNQAKSWFLSTVSHELRTPLSIVIGNLELLGKNRQLSSNKDLVDQLHDADEYARYMLDLVNDLLDLTKAEAGKLELNLTLVNLSCLFRRLTKQMSDVAQTRSISLTQEIDDELIAQVDTVKVQQIVSNLLSNAIKFSPQGSTVHIKCFKSAVSVILEVEDAGCGMNEQQLLEVGKPFVRFSNEFSDQAMDPALKGSGLGLALVKSFVSLHEGKFEIESQVGKGTTVKVSFPI